MVQCAFCTKFDNEVSRDVLHLNINYGKKIQNCKALLMHVSKKMRFIIHQMRINLLRMKILL